MKKNIRMGLLCSAMFFTGGAFLPLVAQADPNGVEAKEPSSTTPAPSAEAKPWISGDVVMELQDEWGVDSDDEDNERNNLFWRTEVGPTIRLGEHFFIDGNAVLEPVRDGDPGEDRYFDDEGAFIEELKLNYENGPWAAFAGKFNPRFGMAWDWGRGIWSEDFAEDYEITEKVGVGGSYTFEGANTGAHTLTASTFFADTSFLSESAIRSRGHNSKDDGGVSNTEDFSSYVVSLESENAANVENLHYQLAYRHQAEGDADTGGDDENGYEGTLGYVFPISDRVKADAMVEYANIDNFEASLDDRDYISASVITKIDDKWNLTVGYTSRQTDVDGGGDVNDHLLQVSGGYDFGNGLTLEAGWRGTEEDDIDNNIVGGLARYQFSF